jgi:hypothetical protein
MSSQALFTEGSMHQWPCACLFTPTSIPTNVNKCNLHFTAELVEKKVNIVSFSRATVVAAAKVAIINGAAALIPVGSTQAKLQVLSIPSIHYACFRSPRVISVRPACGAPIFIAARVHRARGH